MKKKLTKNVSKKDIVSEIEERFKRHTGVLMEQMQKEVETVAEGHNAIMRKLNEHDEKFEQIGQTLNVHDTKFAEHNQRLNRIEMVVTDTNKQVKEIKGKIADHETRITKVEEKVNA